MDENYSVYDHLKAHDIIDTLKPLLDTGAYELRHVDGKFVAKSLQIAKDTPWIHIRHADGFDCSMWHQIIFNAVSLKLPEGQRFVPRNCQNCWKVVIRPRTVQQLFNLHEMQKIMDLPSKSGIEVREHVHGLYGGYFYNKSKEQGIECYNAVYDAVSHNEILKPLLDEVDQDGRTTRLMLKRACTEFEHACGPSDKWEVTPEQNEVENLVERYVVPDNMVIKQPEHLIWNIKRRWIEWAWKNGDTTYSRYTNGKPLYPDYVTYHPRR
jgi:hypothetical protein